MKSYIISTILPSQSTNKIEKAYRENLRIVYM